MFRLGRSRQDQQWMWWSPLTQIRIGRCRRSASPVAPPTVQLQPLPHCVPCFSSRCLTHIPETRSVWLVIFHATAVLLPACYCWVHREKLIVAQPLSWNPKVRDHLHKSPLLEPILGWINPVHTHLAYFIQNRCNIILPSTLTSSGRCFSSVFPLCRLSNCHRC